MTKRCLPSLGTALPSLGTTSPSLITTSVVSIYVTDERCSLSTKNKHERMRKASTCPAAIGKFWGGPTSCSRPARFQMNNSCALQSAPKQPRMNRPKSETSAKWNPKKCSDQARRKAETCSILSPIQSPTATLSTNEKIEK